VRPTRLAFPTVTQVVPLKPRYVASRMEWPGASAESRPQVPEAPETVSTDGTLLDHFTREVRSAWVPSLKKPVAAALPAVPGAYWTRSATATIRLRAALLTTTMAFDATGCPEKTMLPFSVAWPSASAWTRPRVPASLLTEMMAALAGSTLQSTNSVTRPPSGTAGPPSAISVATACVVPPAGRMAGSVVRVSVAVKRSPGWQLPCFAPSGTEQNCRTGQLSLVLQVAPVRSSLQPTPRLPSARAAPASAGRST